VLRPLSRRVRGRTVDFSAPCKKPRRQQAQTEDHRDGEDARRGDPRLADRQTFPEAGVDLAQVILPRAPDQREERQRGEDQQEVDQHRHQRLAGLLGRRPEDHRVEVPHHRLQRQQKADQREAERGGDHHRLGRVDIADGAEQGPHDTARTTSTLAMIVRARAAKPGKLFGAARGCRP
jgi:hypothetical protein